MKSSSHYHYSSLLSLGIPIIIGQLGTIAQGFADTLMIGHHGTDELAAAAFVTNMFVFAICLSTGYAYGLTPIIGSLYGREQSLRIGEIFKNGLIANMLFGIILTILMLILYINIEHLRQPQELLRLMKPYFLVNLVSLPFVVICNTFKQVFDGTTRTKIAMWILIIGNLLNIIGNYILIYGHFGFPEFGLFGAGISTLLSRIIMSIIFIIVFIFNKDYNEIRLGFRKGQIKYKDIRKCHTMGYPLSLQLGMESGAFSLSSIMVGWIGTVALAAHQVMLTISQLFFMVYYGMSAAVTVKVSYYLGRKEHNVLLKTAATGFHLILIIALIVAIPIFTFKSTIGHLFTQNEDVIQLVSLLIIPLIVYQIGDGMQCNYANALRGISRVKPLMYISFISYFIICLPLGYVFGFVLGWGILGIWFSFPIGLTTAGLAYYFSYKKYIKQMLSPQTQCR